MATAKKDKQAAKVAKNKAAAQKQSADDHDKYVSDSDQKTITKHLVKELNKGQDLPIAFSLNGPNPTEVKTFISTGCTVLDFLIANRPNGGIPAGKITEIVGEEASGKSLVATQILANTQKMGGIAIYLDTEYAANPDFMRRLGIDMDKLVYMNPGSIEDCYAAVEKTIMMARAQNTQCPVTIVWDSIAATPPQAEIEGDYDPNSRIGLAGKAHAKGLRKITHMVGIDKVTLVLTNQLKVKIGVMFGDPMTTPGGKAIPYHSSVRLKLTKSKEQSEGAGKLKETLGFNTIAKVFKNRLGPPSRRCEFKIMFASGIDDHDSIRDYLWEIRGVIKKANGFMKLEMPDGSEKKFRAKDFTKLMKEPDFSEYVHALLEELCVIKYDDQDIPDMKLDEDSLLEIESLTSDLGVTN